MALSRAELACRYTTTPLHADRYEAFLVGRRQLPPFTMIGALLRLGLLYEAGRPNSVASAWFNCEVSQLLEHGIPTSRPTLFRIYGGDMPEGYVIQHEVWKHFLAYNPLRGCFADRPHEMFERLQKQRTQLDIQRRPIPAWAYTNIIAFAALGHLSTMVPIECIADPDHQDVYVEGLERAYRGKLGAAVVEAGGFAAWMRQRETRITVQAEYHDALHADVTGFRLAREAIFHARRKRKLSDVVEAKSA